MPVARIISAVLLAVLLLGAIASARMIWIPVAGPMFRKADKRYVTVKAQLISPSGGPASGTVKLDCNAGDDADRLVVKAEKLPLGASCKVWFTTSDGKRLGDPYVVAAEADGSLKVTVFGSLCYLKDYPHLVIVVDHKVVLTADLRPPPASPSPASPSPASPSPP